MDLTILALASYDKGHDFLREAKQAGARVLLLTSASIKDEAEFPREGYDEIFYMPDNDKVWNREDTIKAVSYLARTERLDRIVPLDDFDLEIAASLREHLRVPGMGETTVRYFRDKLAMRMKAREAGILVPDFVHVLNHAQVNEYMDKVPAPWVLKPRSMAGAIGIRKIENRDHFWQVANELGDEQSQYLLERFVPGDIFHVDSIVSERVLRFSVVSGYGRPPMDVAHGGGVFTTRLLERGTALEQGLQALNWRLLAALGLVRGIAHAEYIQGRDGQLYFLETAARVGGAHIADLVECATGINLWREWAKIEIDGGAGRYTAPTTGSDYAGLIVCLARDEWPNVDMYQDPEIVWRLRRRHHAGFIVRSSSQPRIEQLLTEFSERAGRDYLAVAPPKEHR